MINLAAQHAALALAMIAIAMLAQVVIALVAIGVAARMLDALDRTAASTEAAQRVVEGQLTQFASVDVSDANCMPPVSSRPRHTSPPMLDRLADDALSRCARCGHAAYFHGALNCTRVIDHTRPPLDALTDPTNTCGCRGFIS